jgi:hypothetical protein
VRLDGSTASKVPSAWDSAQAVVVHSFPVAVCEASAASPRAAPTCVRVHTPNRMFDFRKTDRQAEVKQVRPGRAEGPHMGALNAEAVGMALEKDGAFLNSGR